MGIVFWILALATLLGGFTALLSFVPRPLVTPNDPVDPANPFSVSFTVSNNGFIPLTKVDAVLAFKNIHYTGVVFRGYGEGKSDDQFVRFSVDEWNNHHLGIDERFTVSTAETFLGISQSASVGRLEDARIAIIVTYQPWFLPKWFRREKEFRFKTFRQTNGHISWFAEAND